MAHEIQLSDKTFSKIQNKIYNEIGVNLKSSKKLMVKARLLKRLKILSIHDFDEYLRYIDRNNGELVILYNILTTNVTHFFREEHHFDYLINQVLPIIEKNSKNKTIRVWSAGCSSGEEVYTLAIVLKEFFPKTWTIKILGTDINTEVLTIAKEGIYSSEAVKKIPYMLLKKYFYMGTGKNEGFFKVKEVLKQSVTLGRLNLNDNRFPIKNQVNIIFCRNVFIYFDKRTQQKILRKFYRVLKPNGYLFLGHSESINTSEYKDEWTPVFKTTYRK